MNLPRIPQLLVPFPAFRGSPRALTALVPTLIVLGGLPHFPAVFSQTPAALQYPAVFFAAWFGGLVPGLLSTLACSAYSLFFLRPHLVHGPILDMPGFIRSFMFLYTSVFFTLLVTGLQRALVRAAAAIQTRDEFLSLASHELKTPLTSLLLQAELRLRKGGGATAEEAGRQTRGTLRQLGRLRGLIDNMLDISRIESGEAPCNPSRLNLSLLTRECAGHFLELEPACPLTVSAPGTLEVMADPLQLEQVIANLLSNAAKYAPGAAVRISAVAEGQEAVLRVEDDGPGIKPDARSRVFEKFERATTSRSASGLGLGLYICRELAQRNGGTIQLEPGNGARFALRLPLA